jgi:hypothetical protein
MGVAWVPPDRSLPPVFVCGATNHATALSGPVPTVVGGKPVNAYLLKMTCSAMITPNAVGPHTADYDGTAATGLVSAVRTTLDCPVDVVTVWGCNRQVSRFGQTQWLKLNDTLVSQPTPDLACAAATPHRPPESEFSRGIIVQLGAGGGGLTQAPSQQPWPKPAV